MMLQSFFVLPCIKYCCIISIRGHSTVVWWPKETMCEVRWWGAATASAWGTNTHSCNTWCSSIPSIRHQLRDGKQHQGKREVVDLSLTAEECGARAIFSIRLRPVWTLLFAVIPAHTKNKNICANLPNVSVFKLHYPNKGHMVYILH